MTGEALRRSSDGGAGAPLARDPAGRRIARRLREHLPTDVRVGVDLVEIDLFRSRLEGRDDLLRQVFTDGEVAYAHARLRPWQHLAARFAAKEATLKALGSGLAGGIAWRDVEVRRDEAGEPSVVLSGEAARRAAAAGLTRFALSLTHGRRFATAVILAFRR